MALYFIDSLMGDNSNNGLSEEKAFKNFSKINEMTFSAGDRILLKRGCTFTDSLVVNGSGEEYSPIEIGSYGDAVEKPYINVEAADVAVKVTGEYVTVSGLEISNVKGRYGIMINAVIHGAVRGVSVSDCHIHDIWIINDLGPRYEKSKCAWPHEVGGISIETNGDAPTWYEGLQIVHNKIENVNRTGIWLGGKWGGRFKNSLPWMKNPSPGMDDPWYPHINVYIAYNIVDHAHGDGIVALSCQDLLMEYNRVYYANCMSRYGNSNVALWTMNCNDAIVQYNEVSFTGRKYGGDGEGLDIDQNNIRNIFQYNYSHDNEGGFILVCTACNNSNAMRDNIVRNNLSVNDATRSDDALFNISGSMKNIHFVNNTIYRTCKSRFRTFLVCDFLQTGLPRDLYFRNNLFFSTHNDNYSDFEASGNVYFENNVMHNFEALPKWDSIIEENTTVANPALYGQGEVPFTTLDAKGYTPTWTSPLTRLGRHYEECSDKDLFGKDTKGKVYVGAIYNEDIDFKHKTKKVYYFKKG